ncbi:glucose 1-dehydrogenase [Pseudarthrobacter sp. GA104]|uniref:glucose 1-dehydrogenase n=1 Tax=Pseudarthrobacter sp. GA104 TaxID=2676311 RepID=UPI0012F7D6EA|nr:glucose 1-dehydrogenase [Pseudarthrobacter sp. GA104]MUU71493.1 glucose 1-dehydrogenase [Pseudarthrobacter sp. GA104]
MTVKGRVALVTGAAQGLGYTIAANLARAGAIVVIADLQDDEVEKAAARIAAEASAEVFAVSGDVSSAEDSRRWVDTAVERYGRLDILVNNAGIARDKTIRKMTEEQWDAVIRVNLKGPFLCSQAALTPMLEQRHGRIISIGSRAWLGGFGQANYAASKGGLISFTRTLALEGARHGVTANCVVPALMKTPLFENDLSKERQEELAATVPMGRVGEPEEIAWAVQSLAADEAGYITGQHLNVCGGRSL